MATRENLLEQFHLNVNLFQIVIVLLFTIPCSHMIVSMGFAMFLVC